jgi:hypothetical protein
MNGKMYIFDEKLCDNFPCILACIEKYGKVFLVLVSKEGNNFFEKRISKFFFVSFPWGERFGFCVLWKRKSFL